MSTENRDFLVVHTDPLAGIIRDRAKLMPRDVSLGNWLAAGVAMDALELGCADVNMRVCGGGWFLVSAESNWINRGAGAGLRIATAFASLLPLLPPEKRTSSSPTRHEGWLTVYAQDIVVLDGQLMYRIKGEGLPEEHRTLAVRQPFSVAFRVSDPAPVPAPTP